MNHLSLSNEWYMDQYMECNLIITWVDYYNIMCRYRIITSTCYHSVHVKVLNHPCGYFKSSHEQFSGLRKSVSHRHMEWQLIITWVDYYNIMCRYRIITSTCYHSVHVKVLNHPCGYFKSSHEQFSGLRKSVSHRHMEWQLIITWKVYYHIMCW